MLIIITISRCRMGLVKSLEILFHDLILHFSDSEFHA